MPALQKIEAETLAEPQAVLESRAWARAHLWSTCDILDLLDAVDPLQEYAEQSGLVDSIGQDAVQKIIGDAFRSYRVPVNDLAPEREGRGHG